MAGVSQEEFMKAVRDAIGDRDNRCELPKDRSVARVVAESEGLIERFCAMVVDAKMKLYRYVVANRPMRPAVGRAAVTHVTGELDVPAMAAAAQHLVGEHDFTSFAATEATVNRSPVRTVAALDVRREGDLVIFDVRGPGFLMHMVRTIVGSLLEVGRGKQPPDWIADVLGRRDRTQAGPTARPQGLTLMWVQYGDMSS